MKFSHRMIMITARELELEIYWVARPSGRALNRGRSHCRFRNRGIEYVSESGMKRMNGSTKRQCDRALALNPPPNHCVCEGVTVSAWRSGPSGLHAGTHEPVWDIGAGRSEKYRFTQRKIHKNPGGVRI